MPRRGESTGRFRGPRNWCSLGFSPGLHVHHFDERSPLVGRLLDELGGRFAGAATSFGLDPDQDRAIARLGRLQRRGELEAMGRHDAVIMVGGRDQGRQLAYSPFDIMKRAVYTKDFELVVMIGQAVIVDRGAADRVLVKPLVGTRVGPHPRRWGCPPKEAEVKTNKRMRTLQLLEGIILRWVSCDDSHTVLQSRRLSVKHRCDGPLRSVY